VKIKSFYSEGLKITSQMFNDIIFLCETRTKKSYFTRIGNNKMDFKSVLGFILNFVKKTIQVELDNFLEAVKGPNVTMTKQAFSEARKKISPTAFIKMSDAIIKWFYKDTDYKTFKGYRLTAIDGSVLQLTNTQKLRDEYGYVTNKSGKIARALSSGIYDIENDMMITSKITRYDTSERDLAKDHINKLEELGFKNDLIIFDRGYPSKEIISFIEDKKIKYLMRSKVNFIKELKTATKEDQIIEVKHNSQILKIRVLRFMLNSEIEEILLTNVMDKNLGIAEFKELYFKRWSIEVKYDELKNRLEIEDFTGATPIAIEQDFYASIYLSNMVALAKKDANISINKNNKGKELKYEYKVNTNILIGKMKNSLVLMLLEDRPRKRNKMFKKVMREISRNIIPIRPNRSRTRKMGTILSKYSITRKRSL
jgi:hypothetical protein